MTIAEPSPSTTLRRYLTPEVRPSDLARKAGVSRQYVSDVLLGRRPPSERILRAASELGIPVIEEEPDGRAVADERAGEGVASAAPPSISSRAPISRRREESTYGDSES
jgi:transcriptional regulator with XRE-family HTH domain